MLTDIADTPSNNQKIVPEHFKVSVVFLHFLFWFCHLWMGGSWSLSHQGMLAFELLLKFNGFVDRCS